MIAFMLCLHSSRCQERKEKKVVGRQQKPKDGELKEAATS
jgi:hypothetical protein